MIIVTIWSRMSIGCTPDIKNVIYNVVFGLLRGGIFYYFKNQYRNSEKGILEKETCDLGYSDYKCETANNGVVISKDPYKLESNNTEMKKMIVNIHKVNI